MIVTRAVFQKRESESLAPYAVRSVESQGRKHSEKEEAWRTPFQHDRDRIVHSTAFRRLQYKTQVFVYDEGDHYRTRLTHTLETSQIARSIGRALALNEDLVEAISLAHDLGHGPFGHAGEIALSELMKKHGGFEHNAQCIRIVELLEERYPDFSGLNLTYETLEGLKKHADQKKIRRYHSLEAEVVDSSDEISYITHDLDDGLRSALINEEQLQDLSLWKEALKQIKKIYPKIQASEVKKQGIRFMIHRLVVDLTEETLRRIERFKVDSPKALQKIQGPVVGFSEKMEGAKQELKSFLFETLYSHFRVIRMTDKGQRFLKALFEVYLAKPAQLPPEVLKRSRSEGLHRAICDYLSGMTDRFAIDEYKRFFEPDERV